MSRERLRQHRRARSTPVKRNLPSPSRRESLPKYLVPLYTVYLWYVQYRYLRYQVLYNHTTYGTLHEGCYRSSTLTGMVPTTTVRSMLLLYEALVFRYER